MAPAVALGSPSESSLLSVDGGSSEDESSILLGLRSSMGSRTRLTVRRVYSAAAGFVAVKGAPAPPT